MAGDDRYVVRSVGPERAGQVTYTLVDMAGQLVRVTIPRRLTTDELAGPILTHAVGCRRHAPPRPA